MNTSQTLIRIGVVAVALALALSMTLQVGAAKGGIDLDSVVSSSYGTFGGVAYTKYEGRFVGTTAGDYSVPFEIVAPANPAQGNGIVILEPLHLMGGAIAREAYLTPEFLFTQGFSYAAIRWHPDEVNPFEGYSTADAVEILHNFAKALREDLATRDMVGNVSRLYGVGVSKTCEPLHALNHTPGKGLLDLTLLIVPEWPEETHEQPSDSNPVIVFLSESDLVRSKILSTHTDALRGSSPTYRSYEVAGAPHIPDVSWLRDVGVAMFGITSEGTTPLDWTPVARALFLAGHRWVTEGIEPPPSVSITKGATSQIDAVYQSRYGLELETEIARDAEGNAQGGIRLPDLEVGRGRFVAVDPASFLGMGVYGDFDDLKCAPLSGGGTRFEDHEAYVTQFTEQAQKLVADKFLLPEDAERMIGKVKRSDVGNPSACAPTTLPVTGGSKRSGSTVQLLALAGLIAVGAVIGLRQWARTASR